jgi:hypothetical protein
MRYSSLTLLFLFFHCTCGRAQESLVSARETPVDLLTNYLESFHTEKVYVSHDKPGYAPGETIWCKVFMLDGATHRAFAATPVVYLDWISPGGTILKTFTLQTKGGNASLDIVTTSKDTTGSYTLRAYTRYQRNFEPEYLFQKPIRLLDLRGDQDTEVDTAKDFSLQFFPEGGHLIAGMENTIAFKAQNERGRSISVRGELLNAGGEPAGTVQTIHEGIGLLKLPAGTGNGYSVRLNHEGMEKTFPLPAALSSGHQLKVTTRNTDQIQLILKSNTPAKLEGCTLVGHVRGQVFLNEEFGNNGQQKRALAKKDIPSGLLHFTLFDARQRPVCERLVFNKNPDEAVGIGIETDKESYPKRGQVNLQLTSSQKYNLDSANLSMSVYHSDLLGENATTIDVKNYLWLQSELKGRINDIGQYFSGDDAKTNTLLDLLLMTHGWRKFSWQDVLAQRLPDIAYPPEEHLSFAGKVVKYERETPVKADVQLSVLSADNFTVLNLTTGEDGLFCFGGFDFRDTTEVMLQANVFRDKNEEKRAKGKFGGLGSSYVDIYPLKEAPFTFHAAYNLPERTYRTEALKEYAFNTRQEQLAASPEEFSLSVDLAEITVTSGRNRAEIREQEIENRYHEKGVFYFGGTQKFRADNPEFDGFPKNNIYDLISLVVPSVKRTTRNGKPGIVIGSFSGGLQPVIVLDGRVIDSTAEHMIDPNSIAVIDVLVGTFSQLYVIKGTVISLLSKKPGEIELPNPGKLQLRHPGFYRAREFYSPDYTESPKTDAADYRTTLFWSSAQSGTSFDFFTGDKAGNYFVRVEGVTEGGIPFTGVGRFLVE